MVVVSSGMNSVTVSVVVVSVFFFSFFSFFFGLAGKIKENKLVRRPFFLSCGAGAFGAGASAVTLFS